MRSGTAERTPCRAAFVLLASLAMSCHKSAPPPRSLVEDKARRDVPIAVCRKPLTPADVNESGAPRPEAYWSALLPAFRAFNTTFDAVDCAGQVLSPKAKPTSGTSPTIHVSSSDSTIAPIPDGTQLVWLRTFAPSDRSASGPLALVRPRPSELDVYAIGSYAGSVAHSRFELAKLGVTPVVAIRDDACADVKVETECESTLSLALVVGGQLLMAATTPAERLKYGNLKDVGRVKWRLTIDAPIFEPQAVRIKEKLSVHDLADNEVRKLEGERVFTLRGNELVASAASIWGEIERR
jgi:hypothetical protein